MSEPPRYELYRVITDYEALQEAFSDRIEDLNVSRITVDAAGGFTPGYSSKLLCTPPMKTLGAGTLAKMLKATGLVLIAVVDDIRFAETKAKMGKRKKTVRAVARIKRVKGHFSKENASNYGKKRWHGVPDEVRSNLMRKVINARWRKQRREMRATASRSAPCSTALPISPPELGLPASLVSSVA